MRIQVYKDIWKAGKPQIIQPLTDPVFDLNILLFDEVIDKGITIETAINNLKSMGVKSITTASLCYKPTSSIRPDFYAFTTSAWVVFPHEIREFIEQSYKTWKSDGKSESEITRIFSFCPFGQSLIDPKACRSKTSLSLANDRDTFT